LSASITHAHPHGQEGAVLVACATAFALGGCRPLDILQEVTALCSLDPFKSRLAIAKTWLQSGFDPPTSEVTRQLGNKITASESCITAIFLALWFLDKPFQSLQNFIASCRGDVDTIGAMAGAVWGSANGVTRLPSVHLANLEQRERLVTLASALHAGRR
jgi:poly(ADP-ribose) glycohydrolase ARH3